MSTIKKPPVDVVIVGFGWTGAIMGMELTESGLSVLALDAVSSVKPTRTLPIRALPTN